MTERQKPTWLRDAERYVKAMQRDEAQRQKRESELVGTIARLTEENLELGGKQGTQKTAKPSDDDAENAALEIKESRELAQQEPKT
jgi:hypothetical protein